MADTILTALRDDPLADVVNITDAGYPGDPNGTPANHDYFEQNVHNYMAVLGKHALPSRTFEVSPAYAGLGDPYFETVSDAYTAATGTTSSNKLLIRVKATATSYATSITMNKNGHITFQGDNKHTSVMSAAINITAGIHIFNEIGFNSDIVISGGTVIFDNCTQLNGVCTISGGATVIISDCKSWGFTSLTGNGNTLFMENIKSVKVGTGGDVLNSIKLASGMTGGVYVFNNVRMEGLLSNTGSLTIEESQLKENGTARPAY